ncbi:hypothetical protein, partial [Mycobacterium tuberculosis]|uniref:hypothetical protein n=1 Tax=Mycobacterium tuberculosis TaxID=1773 RepID=UPI0019D45C3B
LAFAGDLRLGQRAVEQVATVGGRRAAHVVAGDVPPATVAEPRETLADLRAVLDRLEKAIDAAETPGG